MSSPAPAGVYVDPVSGRHAGSPAALLAARSLVHSSQHGLVFDATIDSPARQALAGANSRFSLPAIAARVASLVGEAGATVQAQLGRLAAMQQQRSRGPAPEQQRPRGAAGS